MMNFEIPKAIADYLKVLDSFIEAEIKPLENENDNIRFFDHRREDARTDWHKGGLPSQEWEDPPDSSQKQGHSCWTLHLPSSQRARRAKRF